MAARPDRTELIFLAIPYRSAMEDLVEAVEMAARQIGRQLIRRDQHFGPGEQIEEAARNNG